MSDCSISLPSTPTSPSTQFFQITNTVAVTSVPKAFFEPLTLDVLRNHFAKYGDINQWVPLPGFSRIIVVFYSEEHAETAKRYCDPIILKGSQDISPAVLRVYRADPSPLIPQDASTTIPDANYLAPPPLEKNFLISPPGSPPVGWEPVKEEPPNATPLAHDLMAALRRLQTHERRSSLSVLLEPHEGSGVGVYLEDCGSDYEEEISEVDWVYGESSPARTKWKSTATAMPPMITA